MGRSNWTRDLGVVDGKLERALGGPHQLGAQRHVDVVEDTAPQHAVVAGGPHPPGPATVELHPGDLPRHVEGGDDLAGGVLEHEGGRGRRRRRRPRGPSRPARRRARRVWCPRACSRRRRAWPAAARGRAGRRAPAPPRRRSHVGGPQPGRGAGRWLRGAAPPPWRRRRRTTNGPGKGSLPSSSWITTMSTSPRPRPPADSGTSTPSHPRSAIVYHSSGVTPTGSSIMARTYVGGASDASVARTAAAEIFLLARRR